MRRSLPLLIAALLALALPADAGPVWQPDAFSAKIDNLATSGMFGTPDSLAYHAHVSRRAMNNYERWYCDAVAPVAGTHEADRIGVGTTSFRVTSGNSTWGNWVQVLGSSDTPAVPGFTYYNLHKVQITGTNQTGIWFLQIAFGATGAEGLGNYKYTEGIFNPAGDADKTDAVIMRARRQPAGTKAWARGMSVGTNAKTLDFMIGIHEYEG